MAALPAPNDRERTQWYFQRYVAHLPAAGEMVLFDRSWYNRAGVERVMGFCTDDEYEEFFRSVPEFERMLVRSGIKLIKYWFSITDEEQHMRFLGRIHDPLKQWKLSPMDLESRRRWEEYTKAKEIDAGAHPHPRGAVVGGAGGRQEEGAPELHHATCWARCPTTRSQHPPIALPARVRNADYLRHPVPAEHVRARGVLTRCAGTLIRRVADRLGGRRSKLLPCFAPIAAHLDVPPFISPLTRAYQRNLKALTKATLSSSKRIATQVQRAAAQAAQAAAGARRLARRAWRWARRARGAITSTVRRTCSSSSARSCR